jgi:hypothetical protein
MLIYPRTDPRRYDTRLYAGGGGGDGGAADMRRQEQARQDKVQAAVDAINAKFGIGTDLVDQPRPTAPDLQQIQTQAKAESGGGLHLIPRGLQDSMDATKRYADDTAAWEAAQAGNVRQASIQGVSAPATGPSSRPIADAAAARKAMYQSVADATRDAATRGLDQQFTQASRANTYGLADSGLMGGSADAEAGGDLQRRYGEGKIKATALGTGAAATLENQDEQTRARLIQLAQSGLDTGTAASLATAQLASAGQAAASQAQTANVGNLFGDLSQAYLTNRTLQARYPNGYPTPGQGGSTAYTTSAFNPSGYIGVKG